VDQSAYNSTRVEDLQEILNPISLEDGTFFNDNLRIFSGDGPARQFEAGQQRGGHFPCLCGVHANNHTNLECCYSTRPLSLEDRRHIVLAGTAAEKMKHGIINPFKNLKKNEILQELDARQIYVDESTSKMKLEEIFHEELHGIARLPALMADTLTKSADELNIGTYEVMSCEPLHDITNIVQNILTELPHHIEDQNVKKEYESFSANTLGDKNQLKGSDARLIAIKLAKFTSSNYQNGKISNNIFHLVNALVDIIAICYSQYDKRTPKQILRLYNQTFLFALLCKTVMSNPKKMTSRRFFGSHFHSLTTHAPEIERIICLRSILTEKEERTFGDLRAISEKTTNRQATGIVDNAVIRFNTQQHMQTKDSFRIQESSIQKQASLLPEQDNTIFSSAWIKQRPSLMQAHFQRIADFLLPGENIWWRWIDDDIEFLDGPSEAEYRDEGPTLHHFRSTTLKEERMLLDTIWRECIALSKSKKISIPLPKIKIFASNGKLVTQLFSDQFMQRQENVNTNEGNFFSNAKQMCKKFIIFNACFLYPIQAEIFF